MIFDEIKPSSMVRNYFSYFAFPNLPTRLLLPVAVQSVQASTSIHARARASGINRTTSPSPCPSIALPAAASQPPLSLPNPARAAADHGGTHGVLLPRGSALL